MLITFLTLIAAFVRFWEIGYGLPHFIFGDEGLYIYFALNMGGGDLNPHFYPSLYFYLCFLADIAYILPAWAVGKLASLPDAWTLYLTDPTIFYVLGRSVSALFGTLTIPLTYVAGRKIFQSQRVGVLAAAFLCFSYLHAQFSQIAFIDVTLTFFILAAFYFSVCALESGRLRDFILAGLVGGFAFSTKYNGLGVVLWGPLASLLISIRNKSNLISGILSRQNLFFFIFFFLGFTIGTPYWIQSFPEIAGQILRCWQQWGSHGSGQLGVDGKWNWFHYLFVILPDGLGWPLVAFSVLGFLRLLWKANSKNIFFAVFPLLYFLITGASSVRASRYLLPMVPFLCLAGAQFISSLWGGWEKKKWFPPFVFPFIGALIIAPSAANLARYLALKSVPDTRQLAYEWLEGHLKPQETVSQTSSGILMPTRKKIFILEDLDPTVFDTRVGGISSLKDLEEYRREGVDYLLLDGWHLGIIQNAPQDKEQYQKNLNLYDKFLQDLQKSATMLAEFSPFNTMDTSFDPENVQFVSRSLWKMKRLGPTLRIYKL